MTLLALASAKGSPGVSTAALALAAVWPANRTVLLAEVDPAGSALAPRFALPYDRGVSSLAPASRRGFTTAEIPEHTQVLPMGMGRSEVNALVGVRGPEQSRVLQRFWEAFAAAIADANEPDVIADCGRLTPDSPAMPVVARAHMTLLLTRPDVEGVVQAQLRALALLEAGVEPERLAVVAVGKEPYSQDEVADALDVPVLGTLATDAKMAKVLGGQKGSRPRRMSRSTLMRSARNVSDRLAEVIVPWSERRSADWGSETPEPVPVISRGGDS